MDENGIKAAVLTRIRRQCRGRDLPVVTSEFSLNGTGIRADLAVLGTSFHGIEIKSAADSLKRLPSQLEGYARYFDRTVLVVAPKHIRALRDVDLRGAYVWRQESLGEWQQHAAGEDRRIAGHWLLHLLTAEDERRAHRALQSIAGETDNVVDEAMRAQFELAFRRRYAVTSAAFWDAVRCRDIQAEDIALLSRFHAVRERSRAAALAAEAMWTDWTAQMTAAAAAIQPPQSSSVS
jgi:hypothetical protein